KACRSAFDQILRKITGKGLLTESQVAETLQEIRIALLEADVTLELSQSLSMHCARS
ncbi:Signal recognition particle, SRP54 subunit, helical bundle domain protein, partial [mine drainage metagenome]